jgi:hypothetical protein
MSERVLWLVLLIALSATGYLTRAGQDQGSLELSTLDRAQLTPARVELLDENGRAYVAGDALPVGPGYSDRVVPWKGDFDEALSLLSRSIENPFTRTTQFYSTGKSSIVLPPGTFRLRIYKGIEYKLEDRQVRIEAGRTTRLEVALSRWVNMPEENWYSADDHLHISRPLKELNPMISKWMQAEGINVANLLQFGIWKRFVASPQYKHGPDGVYREGDYLLVSGQENPRSHFLGHTIILGGKSPIHFPDSYFIFRNFWEEARRQGALSGYAHWGTGSEAQAGLAIDLPGGLLDFLEILEAWDANYEVWYEILNSGTRMTPTAGTDYGSVPNLPGRERFYTKIKGPLTLEAWLEGIRRGATFVTNGPILDFQVQGKGMGDEVMLKGPGTVLVEARVRFDPARDNLTRLEVIENGKLLKSCPRLGPSGEIQCRFEHQIEETAWLAVRTWGKKVGEGSPPEGFVPPFRNRDRGAPASLAHSAAIYVTIEGTAGLAEHPRARVLARVWLARLEDLEQRLTGGNIQHLVHEAGETVPDLEYLRRNRPALLESIQGARKFFAERARQ